MKEKFHSSWESSSRWYDKIVGKDGHYYHKNILLPNLENHFKERNRISLLDIGCGQGILASSFPDFKEYVGIDVAPSLIAAAKKKQLPSHYQFLVGDVSKPLAVKKNHFTHALLMLSLQNMSNPDVVIKNIEPHLQEGGKLMIILNHPCFRIPKHSSWDIDQKKFVQSRKINTYLSPQKIPIQTHPGKKESPTTWSFHHPLSSYFEMLGKSDFAVYALEEWCSDKISTGKYAKMEDRARSEFPLFLALFCVKLKTF
jgi:ubiquinone/menaquinone biosynthesis C-methylase UbiE